MHRILFLCTGNSCRSQMAEGFGRALAGSDVEVLSAGTAPLGIHPLARRVMAESGIDLDGQRSKGLDEVDLSEIDLVVTLCGSARDACPVLPAGTRRAHWPLPDPAAATGGEAQVLEVFRSVRDEIESRVRALLASPGAREPAGDA
jgi:arsenate reductase